jgi:hypothetical protein
MLRIKTKSSDAQEKRTVMQFKLSTSTDTTGGGDDTPSSTHLQGETINDKSLVVSDVINGRSVYTREYRELTKEYHHPDHLS